VDDDLLAREALRELGLMWADRRHAPASQAEEGLDEPVKAS
jgi:hypothetical protein